MMTETTSIRPAVNTESIPQPVLTTDINGFITSCNLAAEKLFEITPAKLLNKRIADILLEPDFSEDITRYIVNLTNNEKISGKCLLKKANGTVTPARITLSGILNAENHVTGAIVSIDQDNGENISLYLLETINQTLGNLGDNYSENINKITAFCGQLLNASGALYNRLIDGTLCTIGSWHLAPDLNTKVNPEGTICSDAINNALNDFYYVRNLQETPYADSDPNIKKHKFRTYLGHKVRCNNEPVGSLCVAFQQDYIYTQTDRYILRKLASALEAEESSESLRKSKSRYSELFDFAVEGILTGSPDGIITNANKSIQLMTGFQSEEIIGRHISEVLFTAESSTENPFRFDLLQQNQLLVNERTILCKDNRLITVEMHSKMLPDHTYQSVLFDITARKDAEKNQVLSEKTYLGVINSLNDAIYILDKDGCFVDVNIAAEKLYGYDKEFFIGKTPEFLSVPGMNNMDDVAGFTEEAFSGKSVRFEFWGLRKDGTAFPKEVSLSPGTWFDQEVVIAVGREMTERKRVEESLRINEEKYRMLVQYSSDPIFSYNINETYRFVNDAFATPFGKKPEEIIGKTPYDIFPADEADKRLRLVRQVFQTGEKAEIEVKVVNTRNEEKYYLTMVDPIKDTQGNILWVTCISKEITLRKKAEEELRLKNEQLKVINGEKDKFFSIVAHDLRGPISGFLGLSGIMAEEIETLSPGQLKEIATTMRTSAVNINQLIENLLEWSKMQRGSISCAPEPLFLKSSLTKSIELMKDAADKKEIELRINIPEHIVVFADIHMLETIMRNLISNALKFSYREGTVEIAAEKSLDNLVHISVKDSGIGMSADLISKLFILTENTNRKGTEGEPSTGLGLILCKEFIEKQGGSVRVESKEGEGSTFIFTLPEVKEE